MADSAQEKTEQASGQKLAKSRREGQVSRSKDLSTTLALLASLLVLKYSVALMFEGLSESFNQSFVDFHRAPLSSEELLELVGNSIVLIIKVLLPLSLVSLIVFVFSGLSGGFLFVAKNFFPKFSKLNPITGLGRIFGAQNWVELAKSLLKISLVLWVAWIQVSAALPELLQLQRTSVTTAISTALDISFSIMIQLMLVFILFSLIDIPLQKFFFLKKLRMSKQERKEEHKNSEGKPEVKARIRSLQRQMLQRQITKVIADADVVITNPTHYAVALKYDLKRAQAPFVIAKGTDELALYIRQLADKHQLEVVEVPPLARAIYFTTQINQQIPAPLYTAVAQVLTYILQVKAYRQGRRKKPRLADNIHIPDSLANRA